MSMTQSLFEYPVHLGAGGSAAAQPAFTGMACYADYTERTAGDGSDGRLVGMHQFNADWDSRELHPAGDELVVCLAGSIVLHQELTDGNKATVMLAASEYAINPPGAWHTADVDKAAT